MPISTPCWRRRHRKASPSTWATTRPSPTPRCRTMCRSASASPTRRRSAWSTSTTPTWARTTRRSRNGGTSRSRDDVTDAALAHGPVAEKRRGEGLTAAALITPASIFVGLCLLAPLCILFRYSLNDFVPAKKMMVEAVTVGNYVRFFTDPYYTSILATTVRVAVLVIAVCLVLGFPLAYVVARTQSRFKHLLIILIVLPLFVGNSVRDRKSVV